MFVTDLAIPRSVATVLPYLSPAWNVLRTEVLEAARDVTQQVDCRNPQTLGISRNLSFWQVFTILRPANTECMIAVQ